MDIVNYQFNVYNVSYNNYCIKKLETWNCCAVVFSMMQISIENDEVKEEIDKID